MAEESTRPSRDEAERKRSCRRKKEQSTQSGNFISSGFLSLQLWCREATLPRGRGTGWQKRM